MSTDTTSGVWEYTLDLISEYEKLGIEVYLATMGKPLRRTQRQRVRGYRNIEIFESSYRLEYMEDSWRDLEKAGAWLQELEDELSPDILHFNHLGHACLDWAHPQVVVAHTEMISWWNAVHKTRPTSEWKRYEEIVKKGLEKADAVVTPTLAHGHALKQIYGLTKTPKCFAPGKNNYYSCIPVKQNFVLTIGRIWDAGNNIGALDQIAHRLSWPVCIAGNQKHPQESNVIGLLHLENLGELSPEELNVELSRAAVYAHPALYEPFGLSILQAAQQECALVLSDLPTLRETWAEAAIFVNPNNPTEFQDAIEYLINNPQLRRELGKTAQQRARFYTASRMASLYRNEYFGLLGNPNTNIQPKEYHEHIYT